MSAEKVALVYRVQGELPLPVVTADESLMAGEIFWEFITLLRSFLISAI